MSNIKVVIIGSTHHNTYSMVRCFGEWGIPPYLILCGDANSYVLKSSLLREGFPVRNEEEALGLLVSHADVLEGAAIISCSDTIASMLDLNYDMISQHYHVFNCGKQGALTSSMNKLIQTQKAKEVGFSVPCSVEGDPESVLNTDIPYPRIIKPVESIHGGKQICICDSNGAYQKGLKEFNNKEKVIVQSFIKKEYEIVVLGLSIGNDVVIPGYIQKHRDTKGGTTFSTVRRIETLPSNVIESCVKLSKILKYEGLWGIELIKQGNDYFFVEINLRNDATTYAMAVAGVNLPMLYLKEKTGSDYQPSEKIVEIDAMVEFPDFIHVLKRKVNPFSWYKQLKNSQCRYFYNKNDIEPYRQCKKEFMNMLLKRLIRL